MTPNASAAQTKQYNCRRFGNLGASDRAGPRREFRAEVAPPSGVVVHREVGAVALLPDDVIACVDDVVAIVVARDLSDASSIGWRESC